MRRLGLILPFLGLGVLGYFLLQEQAPEIFVVDAKAFGPPGASMFMVTATIENAGAPDQLVEVRSTKADMVTVMNPEFGDVALTVPGAGQGVLAMDGAHVMMRLSDDGFEQGAFVPLTFVFANAGEVATRIAHAGAMQMSHDMSSGVISDPPVRVSLTTQTPPSAEGFEIALEVENFEFVRTEDDAPHVAPQGHAHVYLNGLKLGRLYAPTFTVGALPPGAYVLRVGLNSNDHRPYLNGDEVVSQSLEFEIE